MISAEMIKDIAVAIEEKGIEFYEKLKDFNNSGTIEGIIEEEKKHIDIFNEIFDTQEGTIKDENFSHSYMNKEVFIAAYAQNDIFDKFNAENLQEKDALNMAILMEKESILFFSQIREMFTEVNKYCSESELIHGLIKEEATHIRKLIAIKDSM